MAHPAFVGSSCAPQCHLDFTVHPLANRVSHFLSFRRVWHRAWQVVGTRSLPWYPPRQLTTTLQPLHCGRASATLTRLATVRKILCLFIRHIAECSPASFRARAPAYAPQSSIPNHHPPYFSTSTSTSEYRTNKEKERKRSKHAAIPPLLRNFG